MHERKSSGKKSTRSGPKGPNKGMKGPNKGPNSIDMSMKTSVNVVNPLQTHAGAGDSIVVGRDIPLPVGLGAAEYEVPVDHEQGTFVREKAEKVISSSQSALQETPPSDNITEISEPKTAPLAANTGVRTPIKKVPVFVQQEDFTDYADDL